MSFADFERLLKDTAGLDPDSLGSSAVERAVKRRLHLCGAKDSQNYWDLVNASDRELQELIEAVVVAETWFFRDREVFATLRRLAQEEWPRTRPEGVLRVLSLPCSTGEEPYSIAIALLDTGLPPSRFRIDGVDISERALAHARQGLYGRSSFRGAEISFRDRHFEPTPHGYRLAEAVRGQVRFQRGNLFSSALFAAGEQYDVIFCRNLLIYFDRATQARAVARLARHLAPQGLLFVGSSETGILLNHNFLSAKLPRAFAFRKAEPTATSNATIALAPSRRSARSPVAPLPGAAELARGRAINLPAAPPILPRGDGAPKQALRIEEARALADAGRFLEAADRCEEHLRLHGPSAQAFYLLGLVRGATGHPQDAIGYYRKALYLEPDHAEALVHLALLMEEQGKHADARVLRNRLQRLSVRHRAI